MNREVSQTLGLQVGRTWSRMEEDGVHCGLSRHLLLLLGKVKGRRARGRQRGTRWRVG